MKNKINYPELDNSLQDEIETNEAEEIAEKEAEQELVNQYKMQIINGTAPKEKYLTPKYKAAFDKAKQEFQILQNERQLEEAKLVRHEKENHDDRVSQEWLVNGSSVTVSHKQMRDYIMVAIQLWKTPHLIISKDGKIRYDFVHTLEGLKLKL